MRKRLGHGGRAPLEASLAARSAFAVGIAVESEAFLRNSVGTSLAWDSFTLAPTRAQVRVFVRRLTSR